MTSEDLQNAMQPRHQGVPQAGRQAGEQFEDGEETPNGGATWPHVAAVPAAVADPGCPRGAGSAAVSQPIMTAGDGGERQ